MTRRVRLTAWIVILGLAAFQAWAQRYAISPDGISYLDMSDAVVTGDWSRLVNLYWSPLYPALVGLVRLVLRSGPATEVPAMHVAGLLSFAALFAAFEYLLSAVLVLANTQCASVLRGRWAAAACYAVFGFFGLTMLPLELTTPDWLSCAAALVAFGALLRAREGTTPPGRAGIVLGAALGIGALAKSFLVPWAIVCLVVFAIATRRAGLRPLVHAVIAWGLFVAPLTAVLSHRAGRLTFGDAGRLTYAWYVNMQDTPSLGLVPSGARRASTDMILPGVGVTGPAPGTNPMWYDPARWNQAIRPHFSFGEQWGNLVVFWRFYVQNFAPLVFLILLIAVAPRGTRRVTWRRGWVVYVPALAGLMAYALVIVTARYVMPFVLAATLVMLATLPRPRRIHPLYALLALAVSVGIEAASPETALGLSLITGIIAAMIAGGLVPATHRVLWLIATLAALVVPHVLLPVSDRPLLMLGAVGLAIVFWIAARAAVRRQRAVHFANGAMAGLLVGLIVAVTIRFNARVREDRVALARAASPLWGNLDWTIARDLARYGVAPGTRIALVGPPAQAYWARTARLNIVAAVPGLLAPRFWNLPPMDRERLLNEFAAAGAQVAIATEPPPNGVPDDSWTPVPYRGWVRRLAPAAPAR